MTDSEAPKPSSGAGALRAAARRIGALRAGLHLAAWTPFLCGLGVLESQHWGPVSDAAEIAVRSWDTFTRYIPLVGQSAQRMAPAAHDVGPLEYWLLAVPVRIDPYRGLMWGGMLCCLVAASITIEAAWSAAGRRGAVVATAALVGIVLWMPGIALEPYWNPWFAVMFFMATCSTGVAVMLGRRGWWPVMVVMASIAADAHMMFAIAAVGLTVLAFGVGLADTIRSRGGLRWIVVGALATVACWTAPIIQQFTAKVGNLTALIDSRHYMGPRTGLGFGVKAITGSTLPPPVWWTPLQSMLQIKVIGGRSAWFGLVVLVFLVLVLVLALGPLRNRLLAALAGLSLIIALGAVITYSGMPLRSLPAHAVPLASMNYLMILMFPLGIAIWLTAATFVVALARRVRERPGAAARQGFDGVAAVPSPRVGRAVAAAGLLVVGVLTVAASTSAATETSLFPAVADRADVRYAQAAAAQIERELPSQPISVAVRTHLEHTQGRVSLGLAWILIQHGYRPEFTRGAADLGPPFALAPDQDLPQVNVVLRKGGAVSVTLRRPGPGT